MINILMSVLEEKNTWNQELEHYIKGKQVLVMPFAFFPKKVSNQDEWNQNYGEHSEYRSRTIHQLMSFGVQPDDIHWMNYFRDDSEVIRTAIQHADVLYFTGGAPELAVQRLEEKGLTSLIQNFDGVIMGYSAGAMLQLETFHITPDDDYDTFFYSKGLGMLKGFDIEVHYEPYMKPYNERVVKERHTPVYALTNEGMMIVHNGELKLYGKIRKFI